LRPVFAAQENHRDEPPSIFACYNWQSKKFCEVVWDLKFTITNCCKMLQHKTRQFAAHIVVTVLRLKSWEQTLYSKSYVDDSAEYHYRHNARSL